MKKVILVGLALVLASCDQSIESCLEKGNEGRDTQQFQSTKKETNEHDYRTPEKKENTEESRISENKPTESEISENKPTESEILENKPTESEILENKPTESEILENKPTESEILENKAIKSEIIEKESKESSPSATLSEPAKNSTDLKKEQDSKSVVTKVVDNKINQQDRNKLRKQSTITKQNKNDGTYENGKLVSNFTEEELRVGTQRSLTNQEIQYYKSLCRYAYMSEQDVIDNRCETKKVRISR